MAEIYEEYEQYENKMDDSLRKIAAIQSLVLGKELTEDEVGTIKEFNCIQEFLEAPNNSKEEADLKKLFCYAIIMGNETGTLPFDLPKDASAESIVAIVDEGLTRIKVAYQLENGQIEDEYEAEEIIIEHQAVRVETFTEFAIRKATELADLGIDVAENKLHNMADVVLDHTDMILTAVEAAYPQAVPVVEFCRTVVNNIKPAIRQQIHKGIALIGDTAKKIAKETIKQLPSLFEKAKQYLLS